MSFNTDLQLDANRLIENFSNKGIPWRPWIFRKKYLSLTLYSSFCDKQTFEYERTGHKFWPVYFYTTLKYVVIQYPMLSPANSVVYLEVKYPYDKRDYLISCGVLYKKHPF